jgi:hypothetical protein
VKDDELAKYGTQHDGTWDWALAERQRRTTPRTGKWMLWPQGEESIEVWRVICELTRAHALGIQAKISCVRNRELSGERLICVYTYDSDDREDLQRVVDQLRESIDPQYRLIYKEDSMTRAGFYSAAHLPASGKKTREYVDRPVSKWYVRPRERTIRAVKGYKPVQSEEQYNGSPSHSLAELITQVDTLESVPSYMSWLSQLSDADFDLWKKWPNAPYYVMGSLEIEREKRIREIRAGIPFHVIHGKVE